MIELLHKNSAKYIRYFEMYISYCFYTLCANQKSSIKNQKLLLVLLVALTCSEVQAQWTDFRRDYKYRFIARVMDADSAVVIPRCHIVNKTQNMGTVSDEFGVFTVTANVGDSIWFSSIGYARLTIAVHDSMYSNDRVIRLQPVVYTLSEVEIGLLSTYDRFKRDALNRQAQEAIKLAPLINQYDVYVTPLPNQGGINIPLGNLSSPITFLYNLWSTEGKQLQYYLSVINGTADFIIIGEKFNGFIVRELTGLENDELVKFMSFCKFTKEYLLLASEMDIRRAVMSKYREYVRIRN